MSLLKWLDHLDKTLFVLIQHDADHSLLDNIMPVLRDPYTWIPLYALLLYYSIRKGRNKAWIFIVLSLLCVAITDSVTTQLLKPMFGRLRPCCEPELYGVVRTLVDCGGQYSMPSNHAANHFGLATFWFFAIRTMTGKKWSWLWIWAAAVCYAQVYVGKHYPFDVLAGSVFGYVTGRGMSRIFAYWWNKEGNGGHRKYGLSLPQLTNADRSL